MRYVLGLDGGGSKCDAVLMDEEGAVRGWGRGGSTHGLYVSPETVTASIRDAVMSATARLKPPIARIAGCTPRVPLHEWLGQPELAERWAPGGEREMGFALALATHGILVLAGTGSFVCGVTADGRTLHEGGLGPVIADEGSAHHIGILGIRAAFYAHYSEQRRTSLAQAVPRALGVESLREVFQLLYVERIGRSRIASVARAVDEEAERGDRVAIDVLQRAADELGLLLVEVVRELDMEDSNDLLIATGSVAQGSRLFWERICEIAHRSAPGLRPVQPRIKPVMGACLLALRDLGVEWREGLVARIVGTSEPFLRKH